MVFPHGSNTKTRWALRCNPSSSGKLHPTEAYVVTAGCTVLEDGVHHYVSRDTSLTIAAASAWVRGSARRLAPRSILVGLSSIHWREAWKYDERAYRYCQHDVGHAIASAMQTRRWVGGRVR